MGMVNTLLLPMALAVLNSEFWPGAVIDVLLIQQHGKSTETIVYIGQKNYLLVSYN